MAKSLAILLMRVLAWFLVSYGIVSLEVAVAITSDPELFSLVTTVLAVAVVAITEALSRVLGGNVVALLLRVAPGVVEKFSRRFIIEKPAEKPSE